MSRLARHLQLIGPLSVVAALGIGSVPALAQTMPTPLSTDCSAIHFDLANPGPGARVEVGGLVLEGVALDSRAQQGSGVDRVDFFLGNRDQGGVSLGTAVPGVATGVDGAESVLPFGPDSFETTIQMPNLLGGHDLFAYAHSSVSGAESVIDVPIALGEDPSQAGVLPTASETDFCAPGSAGATATTPAPAATPTQPSTETAPPVSVAPSSSAITLEVGNPSPGDTIHVGGYMLEGLAFDPAAPQGSGIDRVEIFLDNRDDGGDMLGQATLDSGRAWHAVVTLPSNQTGLHTLSFYAHSSATDKESLVSVPVTIAP